MTEALQSGSYTLGLWAAPWVPLILLILLIAAAYGMYRWLRWRRRNRAGALAAAVERGRQEAVEQLAGVGGRAPSSEDTAASSAADPE
jgi:type II secretory pathway pseudopilin PulG